ncbi:hypothetical protein [Rufibacter latericius]|uniref:STAS/SEC14 domain-containing protein n=1 Tax=Rufibacter latericius TaxID=2487040 RepID=A0A3M9MUI6_9BACT|nr:hypothetical protein [Rufibacter latericius]RNI29184.1 hypothetical protein EFB08_07110 [Rufibacter latericius]
MEALALQVLYEDEVIRIQLERPAAMLQFTFLQQPTTEQFRNGYQLAIDRAQAKGIKLWLTDAQKIKVMLPENQAWLKQNMAPLFTSFQLRKFAIVMAPECFVMTNPNKVYEKPASEKEAPSAWNIKVHFDKEAALEWLLND